MNRGPLILVIEDDLPIRHFLRTGLENQGYRCEEAATGDAGTSLVASLRPELVLLDLGLPDQDGGLVIRAIRAISSVPLLVLSARDQETEKVRALDLGADDYVTKPFGMGELLARIKAALRRQAAFPGPGESKVIFGGLTVDREARRVFLEDQEVHLTPLEYKVLSVLARHPGKILTHSYLLQEVWGLSSSENHHYVRISMAGLRKKLEKNPGSPQFIHTETGVGYRFFR